MSRRFFLRAVKATVATGTVGLASVCSYIYLTTPQPVPAFAYTTNLKDGLGAADRKKIAARLASEEFDVLVIGGGATGASVALDGASRGLKVALIEKEDFSAGTSSRSTKLLHGGVRYLRDAVFKLDKKALHMVYEALRERTHMLNCNPYMNHPIPMLIPCYSYFSLAQNYVGIKLYEVIAAISTLFETNVPSSYFVSKENCQFLYPLLKKVNEDTQAALKGGVMMYDGQQNDSRMNVQLVLTAATEKLMNDWEAAVVLNHAEACGFEFDDAGKITSVKIKASYVDDDEGEIKVKAKCVVNCGGPFADGVRKAANAEEKPMITTSSGSHVILPSTYASQGVGMLLPETSDGRVLFVLPWEGGVCAGTTDVPCELTDRPKPQALENEFIIHETAKYINIPKTDLAADVKASWNGLRPLVRLPSASDSNKTSELSRDFEIVIDSKTGLISVLGGKWTTSRLMGERAIDVAIKINQLQPKQPSRTWGIRVAAALDPENWNPLADEETDGNSQSRVLKESMKLARTSGVSLSDAEYLVRSYGPRHSRSIAGRAGEIDRLRFDLKTLQKKEIPANVSSVFLAEIEHAFEKEMAVTVTDAIARRSRIAFINPLAAKFALPWVVDWAGERNNWSLERKLKELDTAVAFLDTTSY